MKVTVKYEEHDEVAFQMTLRLTLPAKYVNAPTRDLVKLFCDHYNKKHEAHQLVATEFHLKVVGGDHLDQEERVKDVIKAGEELYLLSGSEILPPKRASAAAGAAAAPAPAAAAAASAGGAKEEKRDEEGRVRCKKPGCQKWFHEDNPPELKHHKGGPIFHEVAKWWSCCPDRKAYDFDEFMAIPGCELSFCSNAAASQKRALGGQDLRDKMSGGSNPVRIDPNAPADPLVKLNAIRKGLVAIGVDATVFEDNWKGVLESDGGSHEKAVEHFAAKFGDILDKAGC